MRDVQGRNPDVASRRAVVNALDDAETDLDMDRVVACAYMAASAPLPGRDLRLHVQAALVAYPGRRCWPRKASVDAQAASAAGASYIDGASQLENACPAS